jgi:thiamine-phosphate pyrophosphorylase
VIFGKTLTKILTNHKVDIVCFRDKTSPNFEILAEIFVKICKQFKIKTILINSNINLALKLKANGVHLTSLQFSKIKEAKKHNLFTIISCHSLDDILKAQQYKADIVTYSPIFATPNKSEPKGCQNLTNIIKNTTIPIIALGGIVSKENIAKLQQIDVYGFASIRYFTF